MPPVPPLNTLVPPCTTLNFHRFEVPFNIWCDKCGEHIAKGERFNAEKKAIGNYYSTKILQFSMTHHCGCKITIQTDPKNAEYLVVEGARKKVETYSAADAGVYELPDEQEKEKRERDPFYKLEYQQDAKKKALSSAERLAVLHDIVDDRTADPYAANKAARAALRAAKKADATLDVRRAALGLPGEVRLLPEREGDMAAAEIAFLASGHARAAIGSEERRKVILDQDIFASQGGSMKAGAGSGAAAGAGGTGAGGTRLALPGAGGGVAAGTGGGVRVVGVSVKPGAPGAASYASVAAAVAGKGGERPAGASVPGGLGHGHGLGHERRPGGECGDKHSKAGSGSGSGPGAGAGAAGPGGKADGGPGSGRPGPGAAALAAAAAMAKSARGLVGFAHGTGVAGANGGSSAGLRLGGGAGGAGAKRSLKDKAAELRKRQKGPGGVGLAGPLG